MDNSSLPSSNLPTFKQVLMLESDLSNIPNQEHLPSDSLMPLFSLKIISLILR